MIGGKFHIIDESGIKWWMGSETAAFATPYCIEHHLPLKDPSNATYRWLLCDDHDEGISIPRTPYRQKVYAADKIKSKFIAKIAVVNYNGELLPVAKAKTKDDNYGISAQIMESKHGKQVVIYAGKKGHKNAQIFVDTEHHKLAFDHTDLDPKEIFAKIEATFKDGSKMSIESDPET